MRDERSEQRLRDALVITLTELVHLHSSGFLTPRRQEVYELFRQHVPERLRSKIFVDFAGYAVWAGGGGGRALELSELAMICASLHDGGRTPSQFYTWAAPPSPEAIDAVTPILEAAVAEVQRPAHWDGRTPGTAEPVVASMCLALLDLFVADDCLDEHPLRAAVGGLYKGIHLYLSLIEEERQKGE